MAHHHCRGRQASETAGLKRRETALRNSKSPLRAGKRCMKSVGIAGDFFRFGVGQPKTLNWFFGLLTIAFGDISDAEFIRIEVADEPDAFKGELGNEQYWARYVKDRDLAWAATYAHEGIETLDIFNRKLDQLRQFDFVIGFELSPALKRFLHKNGVKYVCFYNHPIRFLPDLCFGATSNDARAFEALKQYELPRREIDVAVKRLSAAYARVRSTPFLLPNEAPLIFGQTARDASIIKAGQFAKLSDFQDALAEKLASFDAVSFIEHPYRGRDVDAIKLLRSDLGKTVISCRGNNYGLLFCNRETVPLSITLSSSMGIEASVLGIDSHFLLGDPRKRYLLPEVDQEEFLTLGHGVLETSLWKQILFSAKDGGLPTDRGFYFGDNFIRNTLEAWSFKSIQNGVSIERSRRRLFPSALASAEMIDRYCAQMIEDSYLANRDRQKLLDMAEAANVDISVAPLLPAVGRPLQIEPRGGAENDYAMKGFHDPEDWGVWSSSPLASIQIPVARNHGRPVNVRLRITLKMFGNLPWIARFVKIAVNGRAVGAIFTKPSEIDVFSIEFNTIIDGNILEVSFETSRQQPPSEFIVGVQDNRSLGFGLCAIGVRIDEDAYPLMDDSAQPEHWFFWNADETDHGLVPPLEINGPIPDLSNLSEFFRLFQLKEMTWTRERQKIVEELKVLRSGLNDICTEIEGLLPPSDAAGARAEDDNAGLVTPTIFYLAQLKDRLEAQSQTHEVLRSGLNDIRTEIEGLLPPSDIIGAYGKDDDAELVTSTILNLTQLKGRLENQNQAYDAAKLAIAALSQRLAKLESVEKLLLSERAHRLKKS